MSIENFWEQLVIDYISEEKNRYGVNSTGSLVVDVASYDDGTHYISECYLNNSIPLTNERIDEIVEFFNKFRR